MQVGVYAAGIRAAEREFLSTGRLVPHFILNTRSELLLFVMSLLRKCITMLAIKTGQN